MGIFLSSAALAALLMQSPAPDSVRAGLWSRVAADSTDGAAWMDIGRLYLHLTAEYHAHRKPLRDTVWVHAALDTAQLAFTRAERWGTGTRAADSARVYRVYTIGERAAVDWEAGGGAAATLAWHSLPDGLRPPPVLEELGENLLRACPHQGLLFTANEHDTQAAWYLRFARGLRTDLMIVPYARWRTDSVLRGRVRRELRTRDSSIRGLGLARAVCASMGFERAPEERGVKWNKRPLVWVSGKESKADRVPPQDFAFAALRLALDQHDTWIGPAVAVYRRAVSNSGGLCRAFATFDVKSEVGC